jgi:hypothetical protein
LLRFAELNVGHREPNPAIKYIDVDKLLAEDQRNTWWKLWQRTGRDVPVKIPDTLLHRDLFEITVEPLLLYFVALIRPWETPFGEGDIVRNWLYDRLLRHFYDRECTKGDRNFATEFQSFDDYEIVLQAMAFAAWYDGSTRIGTIDVVEKLLRDWDSQVANSFKNIIGASKPAISAALAFYMKPGERPNSFEFLHKTFAEYLVARRMVESIKSIADAFDRSKTGGGARRKEFDETTQLKDWMRLMGPRPIDFDLLRFLRDEVRNSYASAPLAVSIWRDALIGCLQANLRDGMPAQMMFQLPDDQLVRRPQSFREAVEQARNAEEALLASVNSTIMPELHKSAFKPYDIRPPGHDRTSIGNMICRLRGQRTHGNILALTLFSGLDLSGEILHLQDLYNLSAIKADFTHAELFCAILLAANVDGSTFEGTNMNELLAEPRIFKPGQLTKDQSRNLRGQRDPLLSKRAKARPKK